MDYEKLNLTNSLRVVTIPMPQVESVTAMILVGAGSRYEIKALNGISHFLEHMTFKGTKKRPSAWAISSPLDGLGADFNAATSKEETFFYVKVAKQHLAVAMDVLTDIVLNLRLDPQEIEREKGVIVEEINMYEDTPMRRVAELFETLLYPNSSLGWDITGEKETVKAITRKDFIDYRSQLYHPENMILVVAGGFVQSQVEKLAQRFLGSFDSRGIKPLAKDKFEQQKPALLVKHKKTDQTHLVIGVRGNPLAHKDRYVESVLATILGGGMSSRLFIQVRERRGLAYYVRTEVEHYLDNGYLATAAGVDTKRAEEAIAVILEEYCKMAKNSSVSAEELNKAKECVKGRFILELEDSRNVAGLYGTQELLEGKLRTPKKILEAIDRVRVEDVIRVAREFFSNRRLNLAIIGPFPDGGKFEKILKLE